MKRIKAIVKKGAAAFLSLALGAGFTLTPAFAATFTELQDAVTNGTSYYTDETNTEYRIQASKNDENGEVCVKLHEDVTRTDADKKRGIDILKNKNVILDLNGYTVDGSNKSSGDYGYDPVLIVNAGATLTLQDNSEKQTGTITGGMGSHRTNVAHGGGVYISGWAYDSQNDMGGTLIMEGGAISGNAAGNGGVYVDTEGTFEMKGGVITGNTADNTWNKNDSGGGVYVYGGNRDKGNVTLFTMSGDAKITGNTGNGVYNYNGTFTMKDNAAVTGNTSQDSGDGIYTSWKGTTTMGDNASVSGNTSEQNGGGVRNDGTFIMNDNASVSGNTAALDGGGVFANGGKFIMNDNASISGNEAVRGGGVLNGFGPIDMNDDSRISGNTADEAGDDIFSLFDAGYDLGGTLNLGDREWTIDTAESRESKANEKYEPAADGKVTEAIGLKFGYEEADPSQPEQPEVPGGATTDDPSSTPDENPGEIELEEIETPLSGIMTRAQFVDCLWQREDRPEAAVPTFTDVPAHHQYASAVGWAQANNLVSGNGSGEFKPDDSVTVSAARTILTRFAAWKGMDMPTLTTLTDADNALVLNCSQVIAEFFGA